MEFCSLFHDHGCCSWRREWVEKTLNQILLEVLMNYTKHLTSSLTASCVARFMICWVCRLYFSGLVCSVLSLDECLIKINYGRFCVTLRKLFQPVWHRVWLICNGKGLFTRYDFVACDKLTTGLWHDLGQFTRARHFHLDRKSVV